MKEIKTYYHRHMPHYQPEGAIYHTVIRLAGSLPKDVIEELKQKYKNVKEKVRSKKINDPISYHRLYFEEFDLCLSKINYCPNWLNIPVIAELVKEAIRFRDNKEYSLLSYCIMPNHVHILFELNLTEINPSNNVDNKEIGVKNLNISNSSRDSVSTYIVTDIMAGIKKYTAIRANRILDRTGNFWQHESYDHVIRDDDELENTLWYILFNPVKAGLVDYWTKWKWSYCKEGLI